MTQSQSITTSNGGERILAIKRGIADALSGDLRIVPIACALLLLWLIFATLSPVFLSPRNTSNLLMQAVPTGVLALGFIFVLFVAEIDLSLAVLSAVCSAVTATLMVTLGWNVASAIGAGLVTGAFVSLLQAGIVLAFGAPSFLVTLGGSMALQGLLILILPLRAANISLFGTPLADLGVTYLPFWLSWTLWIGGNVVYLALRWASYAALIGRNMRVSLTRAVILPFLISAGLSGLAIWQLNRFEGVPIMVAIFIVILAIAAYVTTQTQFGIHLFAVGGNREAAKRAGVRVNRVVMSAFIIAGMLASVSGLFSAARQVSVSSSSGGGFTLLDAIAAAVIGGVSLFGGRGTVWAALLGALVLATIANGLDLLGVATQWKLIAQGLILVIAILMDAVLVRGRLLIRR